MDVLDLAKAVYFHQQRVTEPHAITTTHPAAAPPDDDGAGPLPDAGAFGADGWPADSIAPSELAPCEKCHSIDLWQSITGTWRCMRCEPPSRSRRLAMLAGRLRAQARPRIRPQESLAGAGTNKVSPGGPSPYAGK